MSQGQRRDWGEQAAFLVGAVGADEDRQHMERGTGRGSQGDGDGDKDGDRG